MWKLHDVDSWQAPRAPHGAARQLAAAMLQRASAALARLAAALALEAAPDRSEPIVEFHAEAGAPEGALYIDGKLVGWIAGVNRL